MEHLSLSRYFYKFTTIYIFTISVRVPVLYIDIGENTIKWISAVNMEKTNLALNLQRIIQLTMQKTGNNESLREELALISGTLSVNTWEQIKQLNKLWLFELCCCANNMNECGR